MSRRGFTDAARWGLCFALVVCFHVAGAAALLARWNDDADPVANAPVITIDLAPLPVASQTKPTDVAPGPQQSETATQPQPEKPAEKIEISPPPAKEAELPASPPPKLMEKLRAKRQLRKVASLARAPSTAEQRSEQAAAPAPGAASQNPNALPNWKSALVAQIERYKRYPSEARGANGIAQLAFNVDRNGGVHNARIVRSSGSSALDSATLDLVARAQPLPPPPPEVRGAQIAITVPIRYSVR